MMAFANLRKWNCLLLAVVVALVGQLSADAHDGDHSNDHSHKPKKVQDAAAYRPTALPDRIVLTWTADPSISQAVTWRTSTEVADGFAQIALATPGPEFVKEAKTITAKSQALKTNLSTAHYHSVEFTGLLPKTKYAYRVGDEVNWSEWFHFTTASDQPEPFSFIYFGDAQNDIRSLWSRVIREAQSDAPKARFMIHAGDLVNTPESDGEWGEWFGAGNWLNAMIPNVPVVGNHEMAKQKEGPSKLTHHWRPQFALPEHGPRGLEESCYTLVYHNVRLVCLNSNEEIDVQTGWLDKVLADTRSEWVVCVFHHPIFSTAKDRDNVNLRNAWKPVLDKYKVDLVLQGHDHSYGRTGLDTPLVTKGNVPTGVNNVDGKTGTVYVVSVSGPKMYNLNSQPIMKRSAEDTQLYQVIHVDGPSLKYQARTATGELYDAFTLNKQPGDINAIVEQAPSTPERLRSTTRPATDKGEKADSKANSKAVAP